MYKSRSLVSPRHIRRLLGRRHQFLCPRSPSLFLPWQARGAGKTKLASHLHPIPQGRTLILIRRVAYLFFLAFYQKGVPAAVSGATEQDSSCLPPGLLRELGGGRLPGAFDLRSIGLPEAGDWVELLTGGWLLPPLPLTVVVVS